MMKIPLIKGWQNMKLNFYIYFLKRKKKVIFDKKHDALHKQGYIRYVYRASPFIFPVFVVWHIIKDVKKGYIVVDFRLFNRIAILNNYLLSLQQEIINIIRGKKYLIVI